MLHRELSVLHNDYNHPHRAYLCHVQFRIFRYRAGLRNNDHGKQAQNQMVHVLKTVKTIL